MLTETIPSLEQIAELEQEVATRLRQLADLKRMRPPQVLRDYALAGAEGPVPLSAAFGDREDLIVVHNMGISCAYCTMWADGLNGLLPHLEHRAAFLVVSPDPPDQQRAFARDRGWRFRLLSSAGTSFARDLGFEAGGGTLPGVTTMRRSDSGAILRIASAEFGPYDPFCTCWHLFGLLADGVAGWSPRHRYDERHGASAEEQLHHRLRI